MGVAALSGPVDPAALERGLSQLRALGFETVPADNLGSRSGLFAGDDRERLAAFHALAEDPSIKAIFFARGGHGALRLMPHLDWETLARHPRAYVGYSDVTLLLNQLVSRLGLVAFHGPMAAVDLARDLAAEERDSLLDALAGRLPLTVELNGLGDGSFDVSGPLVGGCLSLLAAGLATPFRVPTEGAILFWEDVNEPLYRLDRMLTQLRLSGSLTGIHGMVIGRIELSGAGMVESDDLGVFLNDLNRTSDWPIGVGCASGHCEPNMTLALGLPARMESASGRLSIGVPG